MVAGHVQNSETKTRSALARARPDALAALREYVDVWSGERELLGQTSQLLFVWPSGQPLHPDTITALFHKHSREAQLPRIRLHDVRHSYATAALKAGVPPKVISERLGHATAAFTLQTYAHVIPGMDQAAANSVAALILGSDAVDDTNGRILGRQVPEGGSKHNWPGTKSQASGGSGGRI